MNLTTISTNFHMLTLVNGVRVWFSYETPIAVQDRDGSTYVRTNQWGTTTGKHLNRMDGGDTDAKAHRLDTEEFEAILNALTTKP